MGAINDDGEASQPQINGVRFEPAYVLSDASTTATVSAYVADTDHPVQLVTFESFQDGFIYPRALRSYAPHNGTLVDDGTTGDESEGDKHYTNNTVSIDLPETPPGDYTIRIAAVNSTMEEITFVDANHMSIVEDNTFISNIKIPAYALHPNYPNPFHERTIVGYSIPFPGDVAIHVCNVLGSRVSTLVNGPQPAGRHNVTWEARELPPGIYTILMEAGDFIRTAKIVKQ
jgi:hypothetical protein